MMILGGKATCRRGGVFGRGGVLGRGGVFGGGIGGGGGALVVFFCGLLWRRGGGQVWRPAALFFAFPPSPPRPH